MRKCDRGRSGYEIMFSAVCFFVCLFIVVVVVFFCFSPVSFQLSDWSAAQSLRLATFSSVVLVHSNHLESHRYYRSKKRNGVLSFLFRKEKRVSSKVLFSFYHSSLLMTAHKLQSEYLLELLYNSPGLSQCLLSRISEKVVSFDFQHDCSFTNKHQLSSCWSDNLRDILKIIIRFEL